MRRIVTVLAGVLAVHAVAGPAGAATATTSIPLSVNVAASCTVTTTGVNFGNYDPAGVASNGDIAVNCNYNLPYKIALDAGVHYASGTRNMLDPGSSNPESYPIGYRIYRDAARTLEWGDSDFAGTYAGGSSFPDIGRGNDMSHPVYGSALSGHNVHAGNYADTVTVTIHY